MPLFHVQDGDRPAWLIADNYGDAVYLWTGAIAHENEMRPKDVVPPDGVALVCHDGEIIEGGAFKVPLAATGGDPEPATRPLPCWHCGTSDDKPAEEHKPTCPIRTPRKAGNCPHCGVDADQAPEYHRTACPIRKGSTAS